MDWQRIESAPRDGTLVRLRHRLLRSEPWTETTGWFETAPNDRCWYALNEFGEDVKVEPSEWMPIANGGSELVDPDYWVKQQAEWLQRNDGETAREWVARLRRHFHAPSKTDLGNADGPR